MVESIPTIILKLKSQNSRPKYDGPLAQKGKSIVLFITTFTIFTVHKLSTKILVVDNEKVWQQVLSQIKENVSSANFRTWFGQTDLQSFDDQNLTLSVPNAFIKQQLSQRYEKLILDSVSQILGKVVQLDFVVDGAKATKKKLESNDEEPAFELTSSINNSLNPTLNLKYTLENFVVGLSNNLAYAAAQAVSQSPGTSYNPLFIYGPSGVGKTHLMQGIGNVLYKKNPYLKVIYAPSERFMNDFVDSIQKKSTGDFRAKYRSCDLFLIDDVQFIAGKDSTQEEFFHTFNELHGKRSQIVLTSDRPPNEIIKLESRLMSRFQGGLMVDMQLPDFATRVAILKAKLAEHQESLPDDILNLIAESAESNTRELEGKLIQVLSNFKLMNQIPDVEHVRKLLGKPQPTSNPNLDHKKVLSSINQYFNLKMSDLTGPRRQKQLVVPRQIAMFILYEDCRLPMERIGQILGGRDHTTIMHGVGKIREAIKRDREIQRLVIEVKQTLIH